MSFSLFFAGIKESDTGLAPPSQWDLVSDKQMMQEEQPLQVGFLSEMVLLNFDFSDANYEDIEDIKVKNVFFSFPGCEMHEDNKPKH